MDEYFEPVRNSNRFIAFDKMRPDPLQRLTTEEYFKRQLIRSTGLADDKLAFVGGSYCVNAFDSVWCYKCRVFIGKLKLKSIR